MKITIIGAGYVGLVSGVCFSEVGVDVSCLDVDSNKIENLRNGIMPIYEPGLKELVIKNIENNRLSFTTDFREAIVGKDIIFLAVGTPSSKDGSADLTAVIEVAEKIGDFIEDYALVVIKSTVPVGTSKIVRQIIQKQLDHRGSKVEFDLASNPEFLKEGAAISDFMSPDRVVVGVDSQKAEDLMRQLYKPFLINNFRVIFMDILSSEMTKYASNAMLATRISFMNDIANLCDRLGANVNDVRRGIGTDSRIGTKFLYPGCGYGGSCFPKDIKALIKTAKENDCTLSVIEAVESVNDSQKHILFSKLVKHFGSEQNLSGKKIAIWGLSFKPETDDIREAPSLVLIDSLSKLGVEINVYDPIANKVVEELLGNNIVNFCNSIYETALNADAIVLVTEWKEFRLPSWSVLKSNMKGNVVIDGRNIYDKQQLVADGFIYYGIGV